MGAVASAALTLRPVLRRRPPQIRPCDGVLVFSVPDEVAVERLVLRGQSSGRADDNEETIRARMEVFRSESQPVIDALKDAGRAVAEVDAQGEPDDVFVEVASWMDGLEGASPSPPPADEEAAGPADDEAEDGAAPSRPAGPTEEQKAAAVVKIQAAGRGMLGRKRVQGIKANQAVQQQGQAKPQAEVDGEAETDGEAEAAPAEQAEAPQAEASQSAEALAAAVDRMLVVCGPSGVGKSTLIHRLLEEHPGVFGFSVSHTTRDPRAGEQDGVDYHFTNAGEAPCPSGRAHARAPCLGRGYAAHEAP